MWRGGRSTLLVLVVLSVAMPPGILFSGPAEGHSGLQSLSRLEVQGNQLVNETGVPIILRGINIADPIVMASQGHFTEADFSYIVENWHPNVIRVPFHPAYWSSTYIENYLVPIVSWGEKYNVYILLDYHDFGDPTDRMDTIKTRWELIAQRFNESVAVLYDIFNEPHSLFWFQWKPLAEDIISSIRAYDPDSVVFVAGVDWGYDLRGAGFNPISYSNVVYSTHPYPKKATPWEDYFGFLASSYPVFAGEWGFRDDGSGEVWDDDRRYAINLMNYLEQKGIGWAAWCLHPTWSPNMISDWAYTPTESGYLVQDTLYETHLTYYESGGLRFQYYDNKNFTELTVGGVDPTVNFDWGAGSPDPQIQNDTFSLRWVGKILADQTDTYTFYTVSDDGVRLWVGGNLIIDQWVDQPPTEHQGSVTLTAGLHRILLEYYDGSGDASVSLYWSSSTFGKQIIPLENLFHVLEPPSLVDLEPPEILSVDIVPGDPELGTGVNISSIVTDNVSVAGVWVNITEPSGETVNISTSFIGSDTWKSSYLPSQLGFHTVTVWANDSSNNWNFSSSQFEVLDRTPPTIANVTAVPDPLTSPGEVNITAEITDHQGVATASLEVVGNQFDPPVNLTMAQYPASQLFYSLINLSVPGTYEFTIWSRDQSWNWGFFEGSFTVQDITPPESEAGENWTVYEGEVVWFDGTNSTDDFGITNWSWTFNDGLTDVTLWGPTTSHRFDVAGTYLVTLTVRDGTGNQDDDTMTVFVLSRPRPMPPADVEVSVLENRSLLVTWSAPDTNTDGSQLTDLDGFNVLRSFSSGGPYTVVGSVPAWNTSFEDVDVERGVTYYYVVIAVNSEGLESDPSQEAFGSIPPLGLISGRVVDNKGGPMKNVTVSLLDGQEDVIKIENTSEDGTFRFDELQSGSYVLLFEKRGYRSERVELELEGGDEVLVGDVSLEPFSLESSVLLISIALLAVVLIVVLVVLLAIARRRKGREET